jgi:hypothetical protein
VINQFEYYGNSDNKNSYAFGMNNVQPFVRMTRNSRVSIGNAGGTGANTLPAATLDVQGNIKIADGTQAAGRVLTSDASGLATWAAPPASTGWSQSGNNISNTNIGNVGIGTTQPSQSLLMVSTNTSGDNWIAIFLNTANATNTYCDGIQIMAGNNAGTQLSYMITFNRPDDNSIGTVTQDASNSVV